MANYDHDLDLRFNFVLNKIENQANRELDELLQQKLKQIEKLHMDVEFTFMAILKCNKMQSYKTFNESWCKHYSILKWFSGLREFIIECEKKYPHLPKIII